MPRIVRGGLIQAIVTHEGTVPMDTIKQAMIEKPWGSARHELWHTAPPPNSKHLPSLR